MEIIVQPVILSGGAGTRLWPFSREAFPKQFLSLSEDNTLLQQTLLRTHSLEAEGIKAVTNNALIVCNESHRFLVAEQLRQIDQQAKSIIIEPEGRNTAPALTLAAHVAIEGGVDPILVVMPSDHLIQNQKVFRDRVIHAAKLAQDQYVVTFGIVPDKPETGFGYIRKGDQLGDQACILNAFVEKPNAETAKAYLQSGDYLWNSGIFVMRASLWLEQIGKHRPDLAECCKQAVHQGKQDSDFFRVNRDVFIQCPADSIDYAVMEKITGNLGSVKAVVLSLDAGWTDLGSWSALSEVMQQDSAGNVTQGDVFTSDTNNSMLCSQNRFLAAIGVYDMVVVETADAVLVAHKDKVQDIKLVTEYLKNTDRSEHIFHTKVHRPWGNYESIDSGSRYQVKRLTVNSGASLSLQLHHRRAEHWIVVSGTAKVTRGDETFLLRENESTYIPLGVKHRLENTGTDPLEIIEVQSGSYLGEDDIVRFEDQYNRD